MLRFHKATLPLRRWAIAAGAALGRRLRPGHVALRAPAAPQSPARTHRPPPGPLPAQGSGRTSASPDWEAQTPDAVPIAQMGKLRCRSWAAKAEPLSSS